MQVPDSPTRSLTCYFLSSIVHAPFRFHNMSARLSKMCKVAAFKALDCMNITFLYVCGETLHAALAVWVSCLLFWNRLVGKHWVCIWVPSCRLTPFHWQSHTDKWYMIDHEAQTDVVLRHGASGQTFLICYNKLMNLAKLQSVDTELS